METKLLLGSGSTLFLFFEAAFTNAYFKTSFWVVWVANSVIEVSNTWPIFWNSILAVGLLNTESRSDKVFINKLQSLELFGVLIRMGVARSR